MLISTEKCGLSWMPIQTGAKVGNCIQVAVVILFATFVGSRVCVGEEIWAIPVVKGKGDDYLLVIDPGKPIHPPLRRLRCEESLPLYIEEMARSANRVKAQLLLRVNVEINQEIGGERSKLLGIKLVCLAPRSSYPLMTRINWNGFTEYLPKEPFADNPFSADKRGDK